MIDRELEKRINIAYSLTEIISYFTGKKLYGRKTLLCPFHDDSKQSAKIYKDDDGEKLHCFSEGRQFTVCDYLKLVEEKLTDWDPGGNVEVVEKKKYDFTKLDGFRNGDMDINEFLKSLALL